MSKILFIGLDAADWELVSAKVANGKLPHLASLIAQGVNGPLRSIYPLFSPSLWATIATGKRPYEHGVTGFTLPDDLGSGLRPYDRTLRRSPAIWNMLTYYKKTSHIVGWWTTAPAETIQGVMVDETFRIARRPCQEQWEIPPASITPASLATILAQERVHPQKLSEALLRFLVPKLYEIDPSGDMRIAAIAKVLAEDLTTLQVTLRLMSEQPWDFTSLYLMGLDCLSHMAMCYRQPILPGEKELDCDLYGAVVDRTYELYDQWIGQLIQAAGEEVTVVIASDHGFYHDARKRAMLGIQETAPVIQHAPIGTLVMKGPNLHQGHTMAHATLLDLCPTLLAIAGLPVGKDMPGKVLLDAFVKKPIVQKICSWDSYWDHACEASPSASRATAESTEAALRQLVALGYLKEMPSNKQAAIKEAQCNQCFHRALSFLDDDRIDQAIPLLEKARIAARQGPQSFSRTDILEELAFLYLRLGARRRAATCFYQIARYRRRDAKEAVQQFWKKTENTPSSNLSFAEACRIRDLMERGTLDEEKVAFITTLARFIAHLKSNDLEKLLGYCMGHPEDYFAHLTTGMLALEHEREEEGIASLRHVASIRPEAADPLAFLAIYYNQKNDFIHAEESAREALYRHPLHRASWLALATALAGQGRRKEAWKAAQEAKKSLIYKNGAYRILADISGQDKSAMRYRELAEKAASLLYKMTYYNPALEHRDRLVKKNSRRPRSDRNLPAAHRGFLSPSSLASRSSSAHPIIVTGLPRSGTSLIMQMLEAGGVLIDTDHHRGPDEHNPQGYFEQEKVKAITPDRDFFTPGTAIKVVIPLVLNLPLHHHYHIIWIRRSLKEVITSQHRMAGAIATESELDQVYHEYELKTADYLYHHGWPLLMLDYRSVLQNPHQSAEAIARFLKRDFDINAMQHAVIPSLHRVKLDRC